MLSSLPASVAPGIPSLSIRKFSPRKVPSYLDESLERLSSQRIIIRTPGKTGVVGGLLVPGPHIHNTVWTRHAKRRKVGWQYKSRCDTPLHQRRCKHREGQAQKLYSQARTYLASIKGSLNRILKTLGPHPTYRDSSRKTRLHVIRLIYGQ